MHTTSTSTCRASPPTSKSASRSGLANSTTISLYSLPPTATPPIEEAESMIELAENRYGKSRGRLMKVTRHPHGHDLREWTVQVLLKGDFDTAHIEGDNSKILPTDTMKNTVY